MNPKILTKHLQKYEKHQQKALDYILIAENERNPKKRIKYYKKARKHFIEAKRHKNWYKNS